MVLINGGALAIESLITGDHPVPAVVEAFYPGQMGAIAILQALFGERNTWGKLPYTMYPETFTQRDLLDFDLRADGGLTYRYYNNSYGAPVYPFGHGLSYTTFTYTWDSPPPATVSIGELARGSGNTGCFNCTRMSFAVRVTNTGSVHGDAVVLGFVTGPDGVRSLFGSTRVSVTAGATVVARVAMDSGCVQAVTSVGADGVRWMTPGLYGVTVGDVAHPAAHTMSVTGSRAAISPSC
eukprot:m.216144 g.216144  ORF g.216144 m.216144 type:complete len:238 (-) comp28182_c0_seq1:46-759(-)